MALSAFRNKRLLAWLSLLAAVLFIAVSDVHTHAFASCTDENARVSVRSNTPTLQIASVANEHRCDCPACQMMLLGSGNAIIAPAIHIQTANTPIVLAKDSQCLILPSYFAQLTSRAPPV